MAIFNFTSAAERAALEAADAESSRALEAEERAMRAEQEVIELKLNADQALILKDLTAEQLGQTEDGISVERSLQVSTVLACVRVIAEGLAQVPCKLLKLAPNGGKQEAVQHPLYRLLHRRPNDWQTSFEFREMIGLHAVLTGNAFVFVNRDAEGRPIELLPYAPDTVTVKREGYVNRYTVKVNNKKIEIPAKNMWHLRGPSLDGWQGLEPIKVAREAIGLSLATVTFGRNLFKNGARPSGLLSTDQQLNAEQIATLKDSWAKTHAGPANALKTAVLANGMKYSPLSVTPDDAQFLQTRELQIEEICRVFRVLPIMVMHNKNATSYNSIEQQMLAHLTHTLAPWFERFEQSAENALLSDKEVIEGYQIKLNTKGLMKGSAQERSTYYAQMRQNGLMTINECRDAEDMDRIDDPLADKIQPAANLFGPSTEGEANKSGDTTNE